MTTPPPTADSDDLAAALAARTASGSAPSVLQALSWYRLPLSIIVENAVGLVALVYLVGWHGVSGTDVAIFAAAYLLGMVGVEVGLHRYFSHRAFAAKPLLQDALAILGAMAGQGTVLMWAVAHRKHHRFTDRDGDPHSPVPRGAGPRATLRGLWHAHFGWYFVPASASSFRDYHRYARDLITDRRLMWVDGHVWTWVALGLLLPAAAGLALTGTLDGAVTALLWGGPIRMLVVDNMTWGVNSLAHTFGDRPYASRDRSANLGWLALPSLGASWHNNHHAFPGSARTALARGQLDPGYWSIRVFAALGLAQLAKPRDEEKNAPAESSGA